jgi:hypothetical protein
MNRWLKEDKDEQAVRYGAPDAPQTDRSGPNAVALSRGTIR